MLSDQITIHAVAPAILPSMVGVNITTCKHQLAEIIQSNYFDGATVTVGSFGDKKSEFNLYTDALDAGADFRDIFALQLKIPLNPSSLNHASSMGFSMTVANSITISLFDEAIAIVSLVMALDAESALSAEVDGRTYFDQFFVKAVSQIVTYHLLKLDKLIVECLRPKIAKALITKDYLSSDVQTPQVAWVHKIFEVDEVRSLSLKTDSRYGKLIAEHVISNYTGSESLLSWGDSVYLTGDQDRQVVLLACETVQYYYFVLDRWNRRLPYAIAKVADKGAAASEKISQGLGMHMRHKIVMKDLGYSDLMQSVAGSLRAPIVAYHESWRVDSLRGNLRQKLPVLQDLITDIQNSSQSKSNRIVEFMLFAVSLLSLVSLFIATHDYVVKSPKDKTTTYEVLLAMLPNKLEDILSFSIALAVFGLVVFGMVRFRVVGFFKSFLFH
jgi:hypothetical protein